MPLHTCTVPYWASPPPPSVLSTLKIIQRLKNPIEHEHFFVCIKIALAIVHLAFLKRKDWINTIAIRMEMQDPATSSPRQLGNLALLNYCLLVMVSLKLGILYI